ncbi:unnamed protein product, partial [Staurois parvus]
MGGHTATYDKMETSRSVRRPESGTWQSGSNGRQRLQGDPGHTVGPAAACDQAVRGPMWADMGLGGTYGKACNLTATYDKMDNRRSVRRFQSGTWQSGSNGRPYRDPGHTVGPA